MNWIKSNILTKGNRDYLHGTDVIPFILDEFKINQNLSIRFHGVMRSNIEISKIEKEIYRKNIKEYCLVVISGEGGKPTELIVGKVDESNPIQGSVPYNEDVIAQDSSFIEDFIEQRTYNGGSFFERLIALNKKLLNRNFGHSNWLFAGLDLLLVPSDDVVIKIKFISSVGNKIFKTKLYCDENECGEIFFSKVIS